MNTVQTTLRILILGLAGLGIASMALAVTPPAPIENQMYCATVVINDPAAVPSPTELTDLLVFGNLNQNGWGQVCAEGLGACGRYYLGPTVNFPKFPGAVGPVWGWFNQGNGAYVAFSGHFNCAGSGPLGCSIGAVLHQKEVLPSRHLNGGFAAWRVADESDCPLP